MTVTIAIWALYGDVLLLRRESGLQRPPPRMVPRRGFVLVAVVLP
jgi:hypothetical protein